MERLHTRPAPLGRTLAILTLTVVAATGMSLVAAPNADAAGRINAAERQMVNRINAYRKAQGLPRLRIDLRLTRAAEWMSRDMIRYNRFSHTDSRGRNPFRRIAAFGYPSRNTWRGENLAAGNRAVGATFRQWRRSPGHRANMVHRRYRAIGIARVRGGKYGWYWTTTFGSRVTRRIG